MVEETMGENISEEEKPPWFEWDTMWRATIFGIILVILAIAGLYVESVTSSLYGKDGFLEGLKVPLKWG